MSAPTTKTMRTIFALPTDAEGREDLSRLSKAIGKMFQIPQAQVSQHPITLALLKAGFVGFNNDFIFITPEIIDKLVYEHELRAPVMPAPGSGARPTPGSYEDRDLSMKYKLQLRTLLAYYHHASHAKGGGISITKKSLADFKLFRATVYDPSKPIVPWTLMTANSEGLSNWNKSVKPSAREFKTFRESTNWVDYKESFIVTLEAQNLTHLIDEKFSITDPDLDEAQSKFMYKVMKDNLLHHEAKRIIKKYKFNKNIRQIWKEICKYYDDSITTSMSADVVLAYLSGVKLDKANWNKGQAEFVTHYRSQILKLNEIAPDSHISDAQGVRMLANVVNGTPNLAPVLNQYRQARKAAGKDISISLDDYVSLLSEQAEIYDNANTRSRSTYRRSANVHAFDDDDEEEGYEVNNHGIDDDEDEEPDLADILEANVNYQRDKNPRNKTNGRFMPRNNKGNFNKNYPQKQQANQMQGKRAFMSGETWNSLSTEDKAIWDGLSDASKLKITTYHFNKGKEYASRDGEANKMEAKEHDLVFDDDGGDGGTIEAKVHDVEQDEPQVKGIEATKMLYDEEGIDFEQIIGAQKSNTKGRIQAKMHSIEEDYSSDEDFADLEVNAHWWKGNTVEEEEEESSDEEIFDYASLYEQDQLQQIAFQVASELTNLPSGATTTAPTRTEETSVRAPEEQAVEQGTTKKQATKREAKSQVASSNSGSSESSNGSGDSEDSSDSEDDDDFDYNAAYEAQQNEILNFDKEAAERVREIEEAEAKKNQKPDKRKSIDGDDKATPAVQQSSSGSSDGKPVTRSKAAKKGIKLPDAGKAPTPPKGPHKASKADAHKKGPGTKKAGANVTPSDGTSTDLVPSTATTDGTTPTTGTETTTTATPKASFAAVAKGLVESTKNTKDATDTTSSNTQPVQPSNEAATNEAGNVATSSSEGKTNEELGEQSKTSSKKGKGKGSKKNKNQRPSAVTPHKSMEEVIADTKQLTDQAKKEARKATSPNMKVPFQGIPKPSPTKDRIKSEEGKYVLKSESEAESEARLEEDDIDFNFADEMLAQQQAAIDLQAALEAANNDSKPATISEFHQDLLDSRGDPNIPMDNTEIPAVTPGQKVKEEDEDGYKEVTAKKKNKKNKKKKKKKKKKSTCGASPLSPI